MQALVLPRVLESVHAATSSVGGVHEALEASDGAARSGDSSRCGVRRLCHFGHCELGDCGQCKSDDDGLSQQMLQADTFTSHTPLQQLAEVTTDSNVTNVHNNFRDLRWCVSVHGYQETRNVRIT